jgi:hypothetical protein
MQKRHAREPIPRENIGFVEMKEAVGQNKVEQRSDTIASLCT